MLHDLATVARRHGRERPQLRDVRVFTTVRVLAALVFVVGDHGVGAEDVEPLLVTAGLGVCFQLVSAFGPGRVRPMAFEAALGADIAVLGVAVHLSGGLSSPLLPLVAIWAVLVVIAHSTVGAIGWISSLIVVVYGVGVLGRLLEFARPEPVAGSRTLVSASLLTLVAAGFGAEHAARRLDESRHELEELSARDALTGLLNRRVFDQRLAEVVAAATRHEIEATLCIVDIDHFKSFNDRYGHPVGDRVLAQVASALVHGTRLEDECFRVGGEEFAVIMPGADPSEALRALDRVRRMLVDADLPELRPTFSSGVADLRVQPDALTAFSEADRALYDAKRAGRNTDRVIAR